MYLTLKELATLFPERQGIEENIFFHTVCDRADILQPKGLFVPLHNQSDELLKAIANGAVAAIWERGKNIPSYTPNHFPVFFTTDLAAAVRKLLQLYINNLNGETNNKMEITNFIFSNKKLLNKNNETYDIAGMLKKIAEVQTDSSERRE